MVQKSLLTNRPFAGKDLPVRYRIYNVGSRYCQFRISTTSRTSSQQKACFCKSVPPEAYVRATLVCHEIWWRSELLFGTYWIQFHFFSSASWSQQAGGLFTFPTVWYWFQNRSAAYDVTLEDEWLQEEFETVAGMSTGTWSKIPAWVHLKPFMSPSIRVISTSHACSSYHVPHLSFLSSTRQCPSVTFRFNPWGNFQSVCCWWVWAWKIAFKTCEFLYMRTRHPLHQAAYGGIQS